MLMMPDRSGPVQECPVADDEDLWQLIFMMLAGLRLVSAVERAQLTLIWCFLWNLRRVCGGH